MKTIIKPEVYDDLYREEQYAKYEQLLKIGISMEGTILDAGCGTGLLFEYLSSSRKTKFQRYVCLDPDPNMLHVASNRLDRHFAILVEGYTEELPFRDKCFDVVISISTIGALSDIQKALYELRRVVQTNGPVVITGHPKTYSQQIHTIDRCFDFVGRFIDDFYVANKRNLPDHTCTITQPTTH
ncbi:MAG: class I SAM-dependent methyltransferase [Desulfurococcaceae archaeon]